MASRLPVHMDGMVYVTSVEDHTFQFMLHHSICSLQTTAEPICFASEIVCAYKGTSCINEILRMKFPEK